LGALVNSTSPGLGLSLGAVGAGVLVEYLAEPTRWVFGILTAAFVLAAAGTALLPESSPRLPGALASLRPNVHVPPASRGPFLGALATVTRGLAPEARGGLLSSVFVVSYLAFSIPAIAAGVAANSVGLTTAAVVYGAVVVVLALVAAGGLLLRRRRSASAVAD